MPDSPPFLGNPKIKQTCCTKPIGCNRVDDGCVHLKNPWKLAEVFKDPTVSCQDRSVAPDGRRLKCAKIDKHDPPHDMREERRA